MILHRVSPRGLHFTLYEDFNKTRVRLGDKYITVDMPLEEMNKCWFNWQMKGQYIQEAFSKLPAEQREFILSGITPEEWDETFKDDEK